MKRSSKLLAGVLAGSLLSGCASMDNRLEQSSDPCDGFHPPNEVLLSGTGKLALLEQRTQCLIKKTREIVSQIGQALADGNLSMAEADEIVSKSERFDFPKHFQDAYRTVPPDKFPRKTAIRLRIISSVIDLHVKRLIAEMEKNARETGTVPRGEFEI